MDTTRSLGPGVGVGTSLSSSLWVRGGEGQQWRIEARRDNRC